MPSVSVCRQSRRGRPSREVTPGPVPGPAGAIRIVGRELDQWRGHERSMAGVPLLLLCARSESASGANVTVDGRRRMLDGVPARGPDSEKVAPSGEGGQFDGQA